ncbi:MAG: hypothetical protein CME93_09095 [Hyphomonadaceae bacterium]|nr:hypothetical protein [Hyphomonadaceae bacterium]CAI8371936.1 MAG: Uncharacterised protein [Hyphomonas sp. TMED17]
MTIEPAIITRAQPGAAETAVLVSQLGLQPIVSPALLLAASPDVTLPDLGAYSGLVFTSANGVRFFAERHAGRALTAWCVGPATLAAAAAAGFSDRHASAGNANDLAALIMRSRPASAGPLLHIANRAARGVLAEQLTRNGYKVTFCPLYHAKPAASLSSEALQAIRRGRRCHLIIHSAKGADAFCQLAEDLTLDHLVVTAISEQAARPLKNLTLNAIHIATESNETALMAKLAAIATRSV